MKATHERRKLTRCTLKWPILIWRRGDVRAAEGYTRNISSEGFYCSTQESFLPGEQLEGRIEMLSQDQEGSQVCIDLHCQVEIVRVDIAGVTAEFGLACKILSYSILIRHRSKFENNHGSMLEVV